MDVTQKETLRNTLRNSARNTLTKMTIRKRGFWNLILRNRQKWNDLFSEIRKKEREIQEMQRLARKLLYKFGVTTEKLASGGNEYGTEGADSL